MTELYYTAFSVHSIAKNEDPKTGETAVEFLEKSEVMFLNEKRTARLLRSMGLLTPIELSQSGSIGSIEYIGRKVKLNGVPFKQVVHKKQNSLKDLDTDYMAAVESGDMETAQRMVDEAARRAGYTTVAYHGTDADRIDSFVGNPRTTEINGFSYTIRHFQSIV